MRLLNRREFNGLCVALGSLVMPHRALALDSTNGGASSGTRRTVRFSDGTVVPALSQALPVSHRGDIRQLSRKKHCALAFPSA